MGAVSLKIGDGTARFRGVSLCSSPLNAVMLLSVLTTNLLVLYVFTSTPKENSGLFLHAQKNMSLISEQVSLILGEIDSSQKKLSRMEKELLGFESIDLSKSSVSNELKIFLHRHRLPLGKDSRTGITEMVSSVGHFCGKSLDLLSLFMTYRVSGPCPDDWSLGQKLILKGCEPLPRRRCLSKIIPKLGLYPFPQSLWKPVSDKIVTWSGIGCKNFECVNGRKLNADCIGCFNLTGENETRKFLKSRSRVEFLIDDVLAMERGGIRTGFDIGGGSGTFAARMAERNVTVFTATLNLDAPYNEFIASRGIFPLYLSLNHRFPFYDGMFDLIRSTSVLDVGGPPEKLEFLMFDLDRTLRAGGLFWLDRFHCIIEEDKPGGLMRLIDMFGYEKLKWVVEEIKPSSSVSGKSEVCLSAVLQKPSRM